MLMFRYFLSNIKIISLLSLIVICSASSKQIKVAPEGFALVVAVPKVNNELLRNVQGLPDSLSFDPLPGASSDTKRMIDLLKEQGFKSSNIIVLGANKSDEVTIERIREAFKTIEIKVKPNDLFLFYYSGHGYFVKDDPKGDDKELDGNDEVLVTYNNYLVDDEINRTYSNSQKFKATRNIMLVDACRSGSTQKLNNLSMLESVKMYNPLFLDCNVLTETYTDEKFNMIYFGASRDENDAHDTGDGGYFTLALKNVYHPIFGKSIKVRQLPCLVSKEMNRLGDKGNGSISYSESGSLSNDIINNHLFKIK